MDILELLFQMLISGAFNIQNLFASRFRGHGRYRALGVRCTAMMMPCRVKDDERYR